MPVRRSAATVEPLAQSDRDALQWLCPSLLSDAMGGDGTLDIGLKPLAPGMRIIGPARTVQSIGGNAAILPALTLLNAGEVLVIEAGGGTHFTCWGDITTLEAHQRKAAGVIVDGAVRDSVESIEIGLPVFARAVIPRGGGPAPDGAIDIPITVGGVRIEPGDVIVGDVDGIVVIPRAHLATVITAAEAKQEKENGWIATIKKGGSLAEILGVPVPEADG